MLGSKAILKKRQRVNLRINNRSKKKLDDLTSRVRNFALSEPRLQCSEGYAICQKQRALRSYAQRTPTALCGRFTLTQSSLCLLLTLLKSELEHNARHHIQEIGRNKGRAHQCVFQRVDEDGTLHQPLHVRTIGRWRL